MNQKPNIVPLSQLNLTDRFLFDEGLEDPSVHQDILSIILNRDIPLLAQNETEKELRFSPSVRSVRMDVFSIDEERVVYNTDEAADRTGSERIKRIHNRVCKVKASEEIGVKYMQAWEEKYYEKEEARQEGLKEGRIEGSQIKLKELISKKLKKGYSPEEIAELLEESLENVKKLIKELSEQNED